MPLIIGVTSGGVLVPVLVDANGVVSVSAAVSSLPSLPAGTNNIGDVDVLTLPSLPAGNNNIGNVDVVTLPALPAGNNNIGNVDVVTLPALPTGTNEIGKIQARNYGLVGGSFQKDPLRLGYSANGDQQVSNTNASAGANTLTGSTVPAGEIWVLEAASVRNVDKAPIRLLILITSGGANTYLKDHTTTVAGEYATWAGAVTLGEGDKAQAVVYDCDAGDDIYLQYHYRRIDIDQ